MKRSSDGFLKLVSPQVPPCPSCESSNVESRMDVEHFPYGSGPNAPMLEAPVRVFSCRDCDFEFLDASAEDAREAAIARYLGIMSPQEVAAVRSTLGLTREKFSELSGIGTASLARWECGSGRQNKALDCLLYLLSFADNIERIWARRAHLGKQETGANKRRGAGLRVLKVHEQLIAEADSFSLQPEPRAGTCTS